LLDADADRADLELRLIKLLLKDRAPVHPFVGNGRRSGSGDGRPSCYRCSRQCRQAPGTDHGFPKSSSRRSFVRALSSGS